MEEIFIPIKGFSKHQISNYGRITTSYLNMGIMSQQIEKKGYKRVTINDDNGNKKSFMVHRLVAEAFIPNINNKPFINHIDGDKTNNHISNLEWVTNKENFAHAVKLGLNARGSKIGRSKLKEEDIPKIREMSKNGINGNKIAKIFKVHKDTIYKILNKETWNHITQ